MGVDASDVELLDWFTSLNSCNLCQRVVRSAKLLTGLLGAAAAAYEVFVEIAHWRFRRCRAGPCDPAKFAAIHCRDNLPRPDRLNRADLYADLGPKAVFQHRFTLGNDCRDYIVNRRSVVADESDNFGSIVAHDVALQSPRRLGLLLLQIVLT